MHLKVNFFVTTEKKATQGGPSVGRDYSIWARAARRCPATNGTNHESEDLKIQEAAVLRQIAELPDTPGASVKRRLLELEAAELGARIVRWEEEDAMR